MIMDVWMHMNHESGWKKKVRSTLLMFSLPWRSSVEVQNFWKEFMQGNSKRGSYETILYFLEIIIFT